MKILVLVEDYPSANSHSLMYVHERNKYYQKNNIDVTVLNFRANENYEYEGIKVITNKYYKTNKLNYDILCLHAANLKHHYLFIKRYNKEFKNIVFFYHGHEIVKISKVYPKEYKWRKRSKIKAICRDIYDEIKFIVWRNELKKIIYKSHLIFVSNFLYEKFKHNINLDQKYLDGHVSIINNSVGEVFETNSYNKEKPKKYDLITIRGTGLDESKYGIDIVTDLAWKNPKLKFLVIGKGKFYEYVEKPDNLEFINTILTHEQMIKYLDESRCVLIPTRLDTQGVLACEVATYGIPTITSNIEICREIFPTFENIFLIDSNTEDLDIIITDLEKKNYGKNEKYFAKNTILKEIKLFNELGANI